MTFKHYLFGTPGKIGKWSLLHALVVHIPLFFCIGYGLIFMNPMILGSGLAITSLIAYGHLARFRSEQ